MSRYCKIKCYESLRNILLLVKFKKKICMISLQMWCVGCDSQCELYRFFGKLLHWFQVKFEETATNVFLCWKAFSVDSLNIFSIWDKNFGNVPFLDKCSSITQFQQKAARISTTLCKIITKSMLLCGKDFSAVFGTEKIAFFTYCEYSSRKTDPWISTLISFAQTSSWHSAV